MRIIHHSATASHLALSRTNLLTLLASLDHGVPETRTMTKKGVDGVFVFIAVTAERDEEHYAAQGQDGPGPAADVLATHTEASCD